jgi:hypothetical protein
MDTLTDRLLALVNEKPGLSDRELADQLLGSAAPQQSVNQAARYLSSQGVIVRNKRPDGRLGNYPGNPVPANAAKAARAKKNHDVAALSEDEIKEVLERSLLSDGWGVNVAWGKTRGIDIEAVQEGLKWVIEVKGPGSRPPMRVNYCLAIIGETLQRMDDPEARYSIALPDLQQYRNLWDRLPRLAKDQTTISLLLVDQTGNVTELE